MLARANCFSVLGVVSEFSFDCVSILIYRKNRSKTFSFMIFLFSDFDYNEKQI